MTLLRSQAAYVLGMVGLMLLSSWDGTHRAWEAVLGDDAGAAMAQFWDLQVESYAFAVLVPFVFSGVYGLHRAEAGWAVAVSGRARLVGYVALVLLSVVCAAEGPVRDLLAVAAPDDVARSLAHYLRRALEGVLAMIGIMLFFDLVRPGPFAAARPQRARPGLS